MKHAYLIMAHKNFEQLGLLLGALDHPQNDLFVHCDARFREATFEALKPFVRESGLTLLSRHEVGWGSYDQIEVELLLFERACEAGPYAYYHLLSGQDFPLKTQDEVHRALEGSDREFVHFTRPQEWERAVRKRISVVRHPAFAARSEACASLEYHLASIKGRLGADRLDPAATYGYGSQWCSVTDDLARDLVARKDWIDAHFSHAMCPDEHVVQSFVLTFGYEDRLARPIGDGSYEACMRMIDWTRGDGSHPSIWTMGDLKELEAAPHWFARKFDGNVDSEILAVLSARMRG